MNRPLQLLVMAIIGVLTSFAAFADTGGNSEFNTTIGGVNYTYHVFTSSGTYTPSLAHNIDVFLVGGGGGGGRGPMNGYSAAGGGGGGGVLIYENYSINTTAFTVTVGAGGYASNSTEYHSGGMGGNSSVWNITAYGGGGGGSFWNQGIGEHGTAGGSSGGASSCNTAVNGSCVIPASGALIGSQGNKGGNGYRGTSNQGGGGGGGCSALGVNGTSGSGGTGGQGCSHNWTGVNVTYGSGGGGGGWSTGNGVGGTGAGNATNAIGGNGTANQGGGGGGGDDEMGGRGGSGIVVIRYVQFFDPGSNIFANLTNINGTGWPASVSFFNVSGTLTFTFFNITGSGYCVAYSGNGTGTNCTAGSGASEFLNTTITQNVTYGGVVAGVTWQSYLNVTASTRYTGASITTFNASTPYNTNTTSTGEILLKINNGTRQVTANTSGNYTIMVNCTASSLATVACPISFYDAKLNVTAIDGFTGNRITNFSINASNAYGSTTVPSSANMSQAELLQGYAWTVSITAPGYADMNTSITPNASLQAYEFNMSQVNSLSITIKDEDTLNPLTGINISLDATGPSSFSTSTNTSFFRFTNLTAGSYTLDFSGYGERTYYVSISNTSAQTLTAYLLNTTFPVTFTVKDRTSGSLIENATFTVLGQQLNGSWVSISQKVTDSFGQVLFNLQQNTGYQFSIVAPGYTTKSGSFSSIIATYTVLLDSSTDQGYASILDEFTYKLSPSSVDFGINNFSITTSSPDGRIQWFAVRVYVNGTEYNLTNISGSPSGGIAQVLTNWTAWGGTQNIRADYYVQSVGVTNLTTFTQTWTIYKYDAGNYTLIGFIDRYSAPNSPIGPVMRAVLATVLAVIVAAGLGLTIGGVGAIVGAGAVYLFAGLFGWLSPGITITVCALLFGLAMIGGRT